VLARQVALAGRGGPLAAAASRATADSGGKGRVWELRAADILQHCGFNPVDEHRLLIDLKPNEACSVSLYELLRVWGYSYKYWTPLALRLRPLFVDVANDDPAAFKKAFSVPTKDPVLVHEFLYLQGGFRPQASKRNEWQWGRNGSVNAALLWPDAFAYFMRVAQDPER
jgi:hypothetical protein